MIWSGTSVRGHIRRSSKSHCRVRTRGKRIQRSVPGSLFAAKRCLATHGHIVERTGFSGASLTLASSSRSPRVPLTLLFDPNVRRTPMPPPSNNRVNGTSVQRPVFRCSRVFRNSILKHRRWIFRALGGPRNTPQKATGGQPASLESSLLSHNHLGVAAACWTQPALATRNQLVPQPLIEVDTSEEGPRAQLSFGRPREVHRQGDKKNDGDDEQRSPSPT